MTVPTGTFQTYAAIGNREDLIDVITNISPRETFVTSNTGSGRANGTYHEWQTDALAAPAANAQIEGDNATASAAVATVRAGNYCQILWKVFQISETQQALNPAGRNSELDYQSAKNSKELAGDIEYALLINAAAASGASGTARTMKGILGWLTTNVTTASATTVDLTETALNDNLQKIWVQGGNPSYTLVGAYQKRKISAFTTNTRNVIAEQKKLIASVNVYDSDFGIVEVRLHHIMQTGAADSVLNLGDMSLWNKAWLRPVLRSPLGKTGSSDMFKIEAELTLESRQEKGAGKMTGYKSA